MQTAQTQCTFTDNYSALCVCLRNRYECIKSAWMSVVLHKGFQFPVDYPNFQSAQLIQGKDVQWTLGALIYRTCFLPLRSVSLLPWCEIALTVNYVFIYSFT